MENQITVKGDAVEYNKTEQENNFLKEKLLQREEMLTVLRQQMIENNSFREKALQRSQKLQEKIRVYEHTIEELNSRFTMQKKRSDKMAKQQSNFLRKYRDQTKKSITAKKDDYWSEIILKLEKENEVLKRQNLFLLEEKQDSIEDIKNLKRNLKKERLMNKRRVMELKKLVESADMDCNKIRKKYNVLFEEKKDMRDEIRQYKNSISTLEKKIDEYDVLFYSTGGSKGVRQIIFPIDKDKKTKRKKKRVKKKRRRVKKKIVGKRKNSQKKTVPLVVKKEHVINSKFLSPKGKITKKGLDNIIESCLYGKNDDVESLLESFDKIEESRPSLKELEKDKIKFDFTEIEKKMETSEIIAENSFQEVPKETVEEKAPENKYEEEIKEVEKDEEVQKEEIKEVEKEEEFQKEEIKEVEKEEELQKEEIPDEEKVEEKDNEVQTLFQKVDTDLENRENSKVTVDELVLEEIDI